MALQKKTGWRKGRTVTIPAHAGADNGICGLRIDEADIVSNLNDQGNGQALAFTLPDNTTRVPHFVKKADFCQTKDGAWSWYSRPEAVYSNGYTYWFPVSQYAEVKVCWFKHSDRTRGEVVLETLTGGTGSGKDDHNNGAGIVLADGKVLVFYSDHNGTVFKCRKQTTVGDPANWDAAVSIEAVQQTAYALPVQVPGTGGSNGGDIYVFYRDTTDTYKRKYKKSTDAGATWGAAVAIFQSPNNSSRTSSLPRPYMHVMVTPTNQRIHFWLSDGNPPEVTDPATGAFINSCYHAYADLGTGNVHKSDGTALSGGTFAAPPAGGFDTAQCTKVLDGYFAQRPYWNWDLTIDEYGYPVAVGIKFTGNGATPYTSADYTYSRWDGRQWITTVINCLSMFGATNTPVAALTVEPYYYAGITVDSSAPKSRLYVAANDPLGDTYARSVWELGSTDNGATWTITRKLNSIRGGERRCIRPTVPRGRQTDCMVLWMEGWYNDFQPAAPANGSGGFFHNMYATGIKGYPAIGDEYYVAWLYTPIGTGTTTVHMYWDNPLAAEQSDKAGTFPNSVYVTNDVHLNRWPCDMVNMANQTAFSAVFMGRYDRAAFDNAIQHAYMSNWSVNASMATVLMRETAIAGNNISLLWNTTSGTFGNTAWSASPAVQTWFTAIGVWRTTTSSGQQRPYLDAVALTAVSGSAAAMPAANSDQPLWLGCTPHQNVTAGYWIGELGFAAVFSTDLTAVQVAALSNSNPFKTPWTWATYGTKTDFNAALSRNAAIGMYGESVTIGASEEQFFEWPSDARAQGITRVPVQLRVECESGGPVKIRIPQMHGLYGGVTLENNEVEEFEFTGTPDVVAYATGAGAVISWGVSGSMGGGA